MAVSANILLDTTYIELFLPRRQAVSADILLREDMKPNSNLLLGPQWKALVLQTAAKPD